MSASIGAMTKAVIPYKSWTLVYLAELEQHKGYFLMVEKDPSREMYRASLGSSRTGVRHELCQKEDALTAMLDGLNLVLAMEEPPIQ